MKKIQTLYKKFVKLDAEVQIREGEIDQDDEEAVAENERFYDEVFEPAYKALVAEVCSLTGMDTAAAKKMVYTPDFALMIGLKVR